MEIPLPLVTKPMISSPGTGEQHLENRTDKSLIGGVKILVNGKIIDASIRNRLNKIASEIRV
mgnify:CR=1 FL=1